MEWVWLAAWDVQSEISHCQWHSHGWGRPERWRNRRRYRWHVLHWVQKISSQPAQVNLRLFRQSQQVTRRLRLLQESRNPPPSRQPALRQVHLTRPIFTEIPFRINDKPLGNRTYHINPRIHNHQDQHPEHYGSANTANCPGGNDELYTRLHEGNQGEGSVVLGGVEVCP